MNYGELDKFQEELRKSILEGSQTKIDEKELNALAFFDWEARKIKLKFKNCGDFSCIQNIQKEAKELISNCARKFERERQEARKL